MKHCSTCEKKIFGDYAECFGGDLICETCLWKEAEEIAGYRKADFFHYNYLKRSYEGHKALLVVLTREELLGFVNNASDELLFNHFDVNLEEGAHNGGYIEMLKQEIIDYNIPLSLREYIAWLINEYRDNVIDLQGWFDLIVSHQQLIDLALEHKLPDALAV